MKYVKNLAILFSLTLAFHSFGTVIIKPVLIDFPKDKSSQEIVLENLGSEEKLFEAFIRQWDQQNNEDVYQETPDIMVVPPMAKIAANGKQKFRIILKNRTDKPSQNAYRLFFTETPNNAKPKSEGASFTIVFKLIVPVFVEGKNYKPTIEKAWSAEIKSQEKNILLTLENKGTKFLKIRSIGAIEFPQFISKDWQYVLPGKKYTWTMPFETAKTPKKLTVNFSQLTDKGEVKDSIVVVPENPVVKEPVRSPVIVPKDSKRKT